MELSLYMDKRLEIVKLMKDKELDDKNRNIKLPKYKYVSQDGEDVRSLTSQQFRWLMEGLTIFPKKSVAPVTPPEYMA
jgi:hypothetical protein